MESYLDHKSSAVSVFDTFDAFCRQCDTGYVPTLRRRGAGLIVGTALIQAGYKVWFMKW